MTRRIATLILAAILWTPTSVFAWGDQGHQLVARIAALRLATMPGGQAIMARIADIIRSAPDDDLNLKEIVGPQGTPSPGQIEQVLATIATWPDHMPGGKQETSPWHFIDIGLFEGPSHLQQRCPNMACVTAKITELVANLKAGQPLLSRQANGQTRRFEIDREVRFLVHFVGDTHQPLHAVTDADAGGNCITTTGFSDSQELHAVWDTSLVNLAVADLVHNTRGTAEPAALIVNEFAAETNAVAALTDPTKIAAESFALAQTAVYGKPRPPIPTIDHFVDVTPSQCRTKAPKAITDLRIDAHAVYDDEPTLKLVRHQLFRAGVRLGDLLGQALGPAARRPTQ